MVDGLARNLCPTGVHQVNQILFLGYTTLTYRKAVPEIMRGADTELHGEKLRPLNRGIQKFLLLTSYENLVVGFRKSFLFQALRDRAVPQLPWLLLESLAGFSHIPASLYCPCLLAEDSPLTKVIMQLVKSLVPGVKNKHPDTVLELDEVFFIFLYNFEKNGLF